jgi:hypothetical protein
MNLARRPNRRDFIRMGSIAGLGLADIMRMQHLFASEKGDRSDVNCIFIFIVGGMPQQDMWDLKPNAPAEIRGDFQNISTNVPGIQISDVLPGCATVADKMAILRSMTHDDSDHGRGFHVMMSGKKAGAGDFNGNQNNNQHPCIGSMVSHLGRPGVLPPYISVPNFLNSGGPSFLGPAHGPFVIDSEPAAPDFSVRDIALPTSIVTKRGELRRRALQEINQFEKRAEQVGKQVRSLDTFYEKAFNLMSSPEARKAFDIQKEPEKVREAYGMTSIGQCSLLARRMVEAGCRFVAVENGHWDTHRKNTYSLRELLCPAFDQAIPALLNDLQDRGMLEKTMVVVTTEFGRTPRINQLAGRDHWPNAFSIVMAGGGVQGGQVIGETDKQAAEVKDRPISPEDMVATILHGLGIDHDKVMHTPLGRPVPIADGGNVVKELFA